jgi:hypothetical protein
MYLISDQTQAQSSKTVHNFCQLTVTNPPKPLKNHNKLTFYGQAQREKNYQALRCRQRTKFHLQCILSTRLAICGAAMKILRQTFISDLKEMFGQTISIRTLDRCLSELKDEGYIGVRRGKKHEAKWSSSIYRLYSVDPDVYYFRKLNLYMRQKLAHRSNTYSTNKITTSSTTGSSNNLILEKIVMKSPTPNPNQMIEIDNYWPSGKTAKVLKEQVGDSYFRQEPIVEEYKAWLKNLGVTKRLRREFNYQFIPFIKKSAALRSKHGTSYIPISKRSLYNSRRIDNLPIVTDNLKASVTLESPKNLDCNVVTAKILPIQEPNMKHVIRNEPMASYGETEEDKAEIEEMLEAFYKKMGIRPKPDARAFFNREKKNEEKTD